jgi:hypothetical protein
MVKRWDSLYDMAVKISIVMLREVKEISRSIVVNCNVDSWKLVQSNIVISNDTNYGH